MSSSLFGPFAAAAASAAPLFQSASQHTTELENACELHEKAIRQSASIARLSLEQAEKLARVAYEQATDIANRSVHLAKAQHSSSINHSSHLHRESQELAFKLHLEQMTQELQHHTQSMTHATETARRENLRDVWSQKSRRGETLLITTTLMFSCFFAIIVEGLLPNDTPGPIVQVFAVGVSVAFSTLFLSIWLTMRYQARMANFNIYNKHQRYTCGLTHASFESYYSCHVTALALNAERLFYAGVLGLVVAATALCYSRFAILYNSLPAAYTFVATSALTIIVLVIFQNVYPGSTREKGMRSKEDTFTGGLREHMRRIHDKDVDPVYLHPDPSRDPMLKAMLMPSPSQRHTSSARLRKASAGSAHRTTQAPAESEPVAAAAATGAPAATAADAAGTALPVQPTPIPPAPALRPLAQSYMREKREKALERLRNGPDEESQPLTGSTDDSDAAASPHAVADDQGDNAVPLRRRGQRGRTRPRRAKRTTSSPAAAASVNDRSSSRSHAVSGSGSDDDADDSTMSASSDRQRRDSDELSSSARSIPVSASSSSSDLSSPSSDLVTPSGDSSTLSDSTPRTPEGSRTILREATPLGNASSLASSVWRIRQAALDAADRDDDQYEEEEDDDVLAGIGLPPPSSTKSRRILSVTHSGREQAHRRAQQGAGSADVSASSSHSVDPELGEARKVKKRKHPRKASAKKR